MLRNSYKVYTNLELCLLHSNSSFKIMFHTNFYFQINSYIKPNVLQNIVFLCSSLLFILFLLTICGFMSEYDVSMYCIHTSIHAGAPASVCGHSRGYLLSSSFTCPYSCEAGPLTGTNTTLAVSKQCSPLPCLTQCWGYKHFQNLLPYYMPVGFFILE